MRVTGRMVYIYGLADPQTGIVRYVGATVNLKRRIYAHNSNSLGAVYHWLRSLNGRPQIMILDIAQPHEDARALERFHIWSHLRAGFPLINSVLR
jgi:predicted GIY-YIG superfamily endonuclease